MFKIVLKYKEILKVTRYNRIMSTFISRPSPVTGKLEWVVQDDNYDYHQEVARSAYADMLHDTERNVKYEQALKMAIDSVKSSGRKALVLDIGTGTGLLSMMAARHGADSITACEAFSPMADCARQVLIDNNLSDRIRIIPKRSTELKVGPGEDLSERCNILVTEVFDTELIGEGAIGTFKHALEELLVKDCIVVPSSAVVYTQVVQSSHFRKWNTFEPITFQVEGQGEPREVKVVPPQEIFTCAGSPGVHDLQLDQVSQDLFQAITGPIPIMRFDFMGREPLVRDRECRVSVTSLMEGRCDAVFLSWVLQMDVRGDIELSCASRWHHPTPHDMQWRDHWMQAVYYPTSRLTVETNQKFDLIANHDEYSWWFDISPANQESHAAVNGGKDQKISRAPVCECGAHIACSRTRIAMLNDSSRNEKYIKTLQKIVKADTVCLCLGDESLLPFIVARLGAAKVYSIQTNPLSARLVQSYCKANHLKPLVTVLEKSVDEITANDFGDQKIDLLVAEPFFVSSSLPWHNIYFLYAHTYLKNLLSPTCRILPSRATIKAIAVSFKDLHKIRANVGICEGFNLSAFDRLIESSSDKADDYTEPHPLWEYPATPLSDVVDLLTIDLSTPLQDSSVVKHEGFAALTGSGSCNGVALWMEYQLDSSPDACRVSTGLLDPPVTGQSLKWDPYTRQGVHLFKSPASIESGSGHQLKHVVTLKANSGEFVFDFEIEKVK